MAENRFGRQYDIFETDVIFRKFVERNIEILGEALNRILKIEPEINHIPRLKEDIIRLF